MWTQILLFEDTQDSKSTLYLFMGDAARSGGQRRGVSKRRGRGKAAMTLSLPEMCKTVNLKLKTADHN